ncbi:MAG TPA: nucleoside triphosphate pyrophosphohydrolase [Caulobacteraceae bacterium]
MDNPERAPDPMSGLIEIMARLRADVGGCPWDREQTFATIAPYTIEEAYEVADAIERGDMDDLREELGDLLFQVIFHARMAEEAGAFEFQDVARAVVRKMIRRHPHVFGDAQARSASEQTLAWEAVKAGERAEKSRGDEASVLAHLPVGLPALTRAMKLAGRAAGVGFVWPSTGEVLDKLHEEIAELEAEIASGDRDKAREELGDVLFVIANLARALDIDAEQALRGANAKFIRRFHFIEQSLAKAGSSPALSNLARMDELWNAAKTAEKRPT